MSNINTVALSGNLTRDPELRTTPNGFSIAKLGIAVNKSKKQEDGTYVDEGHFFDLTVLGKFGELCARKLRKGDAITVQGELEFESWEAADGGGKRSKVSVLARTIDGQAFFRKDEEVPALQSGGNETAPLAEGVSATQDDIPF